MAIHCSAIAWKIPWTEEPDRLQSMGLQRVGQDWVTSLSLCFTILYWFCHTLTWISHGCTWVPNPEPLSHLPPHIISLGHPRAPAPSILYPVSNIDWRLVSYMIVCMFQCHSPKSSHPLVFKITSQYPNMLQRKGIRFCFYELIDLNVLDVFCNTLNQWQSDCNYYPLAASNAHLRLEWGSLQVNSWVFKVFDNFLLFGLTRCFRHIFFISLPCLASVISAKRLVSFPVCGSV